MEGPAGGPGKPKIPKNPLDKTETACYLRANFLEG